VYADKHLLRQAFTHLLSNACKFSRPGGLVSLGGSASLASAASAADGGGVGVAIPSADSGDGFTHGRLSCSWVVEDTGVGIAPENVSRVLEAFGQVRTGATTGTGLGLPLAKAMIEEAHGGKLELSSTVGVGTRIHIALDLPCRWRSGGGDAAGCALPSTSSPPRDFLRTFCSKYAAHLRSGELDRDVLIVDDVQMNRKIIEYRCKKAGFSCAEASDGDEAVETVFPPAQPPRKFGIVLLDLHMDRVNGDEACRHLRERGYAGPIILLSGNRKTDEECTDLVGFDLLLCKGDRPDLGDVFAAVSNVRE
jgi:CheY-like chemotaxis protein